MIKLTNGELSNFLNPALEELLDDKNRRFPTEDSFKLASLLQQIHSKLKVYQKCARDLMEDCGGTITEEGTVNFRALADRKKADEELQKLNSVEVEIEGDRLKWKVTWPELTLREAAILSPLIDKNH